MIDLIVSKYPAKNSRYIYKKIEKDIQEKKKSFLIVPEQYTLQTDIDFIESIKYKTVMDAKILSFNSFSRFIIDRVGGNKEEILSPNAKIMLITNILKENNDKLKLFRDNYKNVDFAKNLADIISQIKDNNIKESDFKKIFDTQIEEEELKYKFEEIKLIYDSYQMAIKDKYIDTEDRLRTVIRKIENADFLVGNKFYFDKFDIFSDLQVELVDALIKKGVKVSISLNLDPQYIYNRMGMDLEMFAGAYQQIDRLNHDFEINIIEADKVLDKKSNIEIEHLADNFEKYNYQEMDQKYLNQLEKIKKNIEGRNKIFYKLNHIKVLENPSTTKEVENIALFLKKQVIENDMRYKDYAIYYTDKGEYENELAKVFTRNKIPYFLDETITLIDNHIIKTYLAALRIVIYNYKIDDLSYFLTSNIFYFKDNQNLNVASLLTYLDERNIKGSMFTKDKYFAFDDEFFGKIYGVDDYRFKYKKSENERVNQIRQAILDLFDKLYKLRNGDHSAREIASTIYKFISNDVFKRGINNYQNFLKEGDYLEKYQQNEQAVEKFIDILDQFIAIMGDRKISLSDTYRLIESASENTKIGIIPPSKDHVVISDLSRSSIANRENNIILGLNDAYFPKVNTNDDLVNEDEKAILREKLGIKLFDEDIAERQIRDIYKIFTRTNNLYLSYANSDKKGEKLEQASILNQISNIFGGIYPHDLSSLENLEIKYSKDVLGKHVLDLIRENRSGKVLTDHEEELIKAYFTIIRKDHSKESDLQLLDDFELANKALFYTNNKKNLENVLSTNLFRQNKWSASQIDKFSRCPYQHFVERGIKPIEKEEFEVDARDEGNIVHGVLEDISKLFVDQDIENMPEDLDRQTYDLIIKDHMEKIRIDDPRNQITTDNIFQKSQENYSRIKKQIEMSDFIVSSAEQSFGYRDSLLPEVKLDHDNSLIGRIDRIDRINEKLNPSKKNYVRVIDYKTGDKKFSIAHVLNRLDFQLVIYLLSLEETEFIPIGSFYLPLKDEIENFGAMNVKYDKSDIDSKKLQNHKMQGLVIDLDNANAKKDTKAEFFQIFDKDADHTFSSIKSTNLANDIILNENEKEDLYAFVRQSTLSMINDIKAGKINLEPVKEGERATCDYCKYRGICKIDPVIDEDRFREVQKFKKEDISKILNEKGGANDWVNHRSKKNSGYKK